MTDALLGSLWRASWQGAVVIAALWGVCRVFEARRWLSADLRCWLWRGAYVKLLLGLFTVARVALPLLPPAAPVAGMPENYRPQTGGAYLPAPVFPVRLPALAETIQGEKQNGPLVSWQTAVASLYLLGVGACVFRVGQKGFATRRLLKAASAKTGDATDAETITEMARLARLFGLRQTPRLLRCSSLSIPCYAANTVLLPAETDYTAQECGLILAHELAHAKRCDLVWEWLGTLAQLVFFFHPLVWLARREERLCREAAADALALRVTQVPAAGYGNLLLRFSLAHAGQPLAGVVGIVDRGGLFRRRLLCLGEERVMDKFAGSHKRFTVSATLFFGVSTALFVPWSLQARAQNKPTTALLKKSGRPAGVAYDAPYQAQERRQKEANAAIASGDTKLAARLAQQMLKNNTDTRDWNYGNVIHQANQLLGLAALQEGRVTEAKQYLIAAAITPGSPQLNSFGPNMVLAQRLLERGEKNVVIQYLDLVARFWAHLTKDELAREKKMKSREDAKVIRVVKVFNQKQIADWKQQIADGRTPTLNRSEQLY